MIDLSVLTTESRNPDTMNLDEMTPLQIAAIMNQEDEKAVKAVEEVLPQIATAIEWATDSLKAGGRIIYIGAGTSGRLGVLDAVECPPTFGVPRELVVGLIAGGDKAFVEAVEGAEDSETLCEAELKEIGLTSKDIVIGLAASGRTPYVIYGLDFANKTGCHTVAIACNKGSDVGKKAKLAIEPVTGPEVLTGSTRLKAGTAQKMILNMISTGSMVGIGKAYENLMVDVKQSNEKLVVRSQNIVMTATGCTREEAETVLKQAEGHVKTAITMILLDCDPEDARQKLSQAGGKIRKALK
ncbi:MULTISPECIES: N-acetylmuramic acid 6-phosphate etherase [Lacrimispora]|jgi:N-acetylmuramic acid 6-phosphate etherase|uniref:N-acetylmuramic acid 6-phosphate etherase n=1 Tax=Lacrimispora TaxID=2719231 RepID=UPI0008C2150C|nr:MULTISPECIES: N-acetylmuramic acid 6-phosphate etherase [Lacrimispora]MDR7812874.1 N-acetylmuramic acid 6-phosphate etherase [Lacrimispora sp.]SET59790.1 N-acetylmuramic acid 6-phosphate etherase [Lacrimispora sphenoides]